MEHNTPPKRVLVVDDEPYVAMILAESLEKVSDDFLVEEAYSGDEALTKIRKAHFALVLTDYKMPNMDGLELAQAIQRLSPDTRLVLMTAFGTAELRDEAEQLQLAGYLDKPFTMAQIREVVERTLECTGPKEAPPTIVRSLGEPVYERLKELHLDTRAHCVLLLHADGYPVDMVGHTGDIDITSLSTLIAANFAAEAEVARLLSSHSTFRSSYHEGPAYNVYSYDVNGEYLLAVVFGEESKVGAVWLYAKQAAAALAPLVDAQAPAHEFESDLAAAVDGKLDQLFKGSERGAGLTLVDIKTERPPVAPGDEGWHEKRE